MPGETNKAQQNKDDDLLCSVLIFYVSFSALTRRRKRAEECRRKAKSKSKSKSGCQS